MRRLRPQHLSEVADLGPDLDDDHRPRVLREPITPRERICPWGHLQACAGTPPLNIEGAKKLVDFAGASRAAGAFAEAQLDGAVAIYNILREQRFAYLADEVGMGKTYVALGAVALMRHLHPGLRVLYVAPRENLQEKWEKERENFVANNWLDADLRVKGFDGAPMQRIAVCRNLIDLVREAARDAHQDFLVRMTSFSFGLSRDSSDGWARRRDELVELLPWLPRAEFDLRNRARFKDLYARAVNAALPAFDLVVVDEGHNLKHGYGSRVASRNRMLALSLGRKDPDLPFFPGGGPRAARVLVLSATPLETSYGELWRQMDVLGMGALAPQLNDPKGDPDEQKEVALRFLVRRLTELRIRGERHTKNMYRRELRRGGVDESDQPLAPADPRQRLVVALVQKKVSEALARAGRRDGSKFRRSFQMGMLASFESFFQTAKVTASEEADPAFDQADQTEDELERLGVDSPAIDRLASSYRRRFKAPLPHPKMDAVAEELGRFVATGDKTLVFVRRIASVGELKEKVARVYDAWLLNLLRHELPSHQEEIERAFAHYEQERTRTGGRRTESPAAQERTSSGNDPQGGLQSEYEDPGDSDTFFAWFFRGTPPEGSELAPAAYRKNRFASEGAALSTFFEENHVAWLLQVKPAEVPAALELHLGSGGMQALRERAYRIHQSHSKQTRFRRYRVFRAYQEAALQALAELDGPLGKQARILCEESYPPGAAGSPTDDPGNFPGPHEPLQTQSLWTELASHPLAQEILPQATWGTLAEFREVYREREQRRELLSSAMQLGHPYVDLWICALRTDAEGHEQGRPVALARSFLDRLNGQAKDQGFSARRELGSLAENFHLLLDVNFPQLRKRSLWELPRVLQRVLGRQTPVAGMSGSINKTLVTQFRMPGYPYILITTDVLQEGEDLHTFASRVMHYGIAWTPSSMEQRTGRIDRIGSLTHRRLQAESACEQHYLRVFYPYLDDTVEVLQAHEIFRRMNRFVRLLHEGFDSGDAGDSRLHVSRAVHQKADSIEPVRTFLESPFRVRNEWLHPPDATSPSPADTSHDLLSHFEGLVESLTRLEHDLTWTSESSAGQRKGQVRRLGATGDSATQTAYAWPLRVQLATTQGGGLPLLRMTLDAVSIKRIDEEIERVFVLHRAYPDLHVSATYRQGEQLALAVGRDIILNRTTTPEEVKQALGRALEFCNLLRTTGEPQPAQQRKSAVLPAPPPTTTTAWVREFGKRRQEVRLATRSVPYLVESRVLTSSAVDALSWSELAELVWLRNDRLRLVGFQLDRQGRLVGRATLPQREVVPAELDRVVDLVAQECDRLEFLRTGSDRY